MRRAVVIQVDNLIGARPPAKKFAPIQIVIGNEFGRNRYCNVAFDTAAGIGFALTLGQERSAVPRLEAMLSIFPQPESRFRIVSRCPTRKSVTVAIRAARPSLLDLRLQGDPWILVHGQESVGVYFDSCRLLSVAALPLDGPGLNRQLHSLRHRAPRPRHRI